MALPLPTISSRVMTVTGMSFARTLDKLDSLLKEGVASASLIEGVVGSDPMLTALVLGQVNAAGRETYALSRAISALGLDSIHGLVREIEPIPADRQKALASCWSSASACALMNRRLVRFLQAQRGLEVPRSFDDESLQVLGLLLDLGMPVAAIRFPDEYQRASLALSRYGERRTFSYLLKDTLGVFPWDLGYMLARAWNLPPLHSEVIRWHHKPHLADQKYRELACAAHIARLLVRSIGYCCIDDRFLDPADPEAFSILRLRIDEVPQLLNDFLDEWEELETFEVGVGR